MGAPGLTDVTPVPAGANVQALSKIKPINNEAVKRITCKIRIDEWDSPFELNQRESREKGRRKNRKKEGEREGKVGG